MNTCSKLFIAIFACLLFTACDDDFTANQDYPVFLTEGASSITNEGVTLSASLLSEGNEAILGYGFIWGEASGDYHFTADISETNSLSAFTYRINSDLKDGVSYKYKPFIQTDNRVVYGVEKYFDAQGTNTAEFTDFNPKIGAPGDIITLSTKYLSKDSERLRINIGGQFVPITEFREDYVKVRIPALPLVCGATSIIVTSGDTPPITGSESFEILGPEITSVNPSPIRIGDSELIVEGVRFSSILGNNKIQLGPYSLEVLRGSETQLVASIPQDIAVGEYDLSLKMVFLTKVFDQKIQVIQ